MIDIEKTQGMAPDYARAIQGALNNSAHLQRMAIEHVEGILNGEVTLVDATNPFVTLLGVNAANVAGLHLSQIQQFRRKFAKLATDSYELYPRMSDQDYIGRFALPHIQKINLMIPVEELKAAAVHLADGSLRVDIPKHSTVTVEGVTYTLMYPVRIIERATGGWAASYDLSVVDPIHDIRNSIIYLSERQGAPNTPAVLFLELELAQIKVASVEVDINPSSGLNKDIAFGDSYCFARVRTKGRNDAVWRELRTTHDDVVHDAGVATATLQVHTGKLNVRIPQIYFNNGAISGRTRIDVYTTKGDIYLDTTGKSVSEFLSDFTGTNLQARTNYEAAFNAIVNKYFFFTGVSAGGKNEVSFEVLRERVIMNTTGPVQNPVTAGQLIESLQTDGFSVRQYVNNATATQLLASRPLPASVDHTLVTPASVTILDAIGSFQELTANPWVVDHGDRLTITPDTIWTNKSGILKLCSLQEISDVVAMDADSMVAAVTDGMYLYSPFHYVLDAGGDTFDVRPYYLENPKAKVDRYVGANETTGMDVSVKALSLEAGASGWRLVVSTTSNSTWKNQNEVHKLAQLSFTPPGIGTRAAITAVSMDTDEAGDDVFIFELHSSFDIDRNHRVGLQGFETGLSADPTVYSELTEQMQITFISGDLLAGSSASPLDADMVMSALPARVRVVAAQMLELELGVYLEHLWAAARTLPAVQQWATYPADVPEVHLHDEWEINPQTNTILFYNADGTTSVKIKHRAGDPIYENGELVIRHRKGSVVYNGAEPVAPSPSSLQRQFSVLLLEGSYRFATDQSTAEYSDQVARVLVSYITGNLAKYNDNARERDQVFFYPRVTLGTVTALVDNSARVQINAEQDFTVRLGVHQRVFDNESLCDTLKRKTVEVIYRFLDREVVAVSGLIDELRSAYGDDVLSVSVTGLAGDADVVTLLEGNERLSLKKVLTILDNGDFTVKEAVTVDIFNHSKVR